ncbi:MAG: amylo-alpha-1,6-glucosidase [Myxococcaceae bacterium]
MTDLPVLSFEWPRGAEAEELLAHEWLVTNGLGGYASGSVAGCNTRRYHGIFVPSLPTPFGRTVMLPRLEETVLVGDSSVRLDGEETDTGALQLPTPWLRRFKVVGLIPQWEYEIGEARIDRRIVMVHRENTAYIEWIHRGGPPVRLRLRPFPAFRFHDRPIPCGELPMAEVRINGFRVEFHVQEGAPPLRIRVAAPGPAPFVALPTLSPRYLYRIERRRGLDCLEQLESPGFFEFQLAAGERAGLGLTVGEWESIEQAPDAFFNHELDRERRLLEHAPEGAREGTTARLVLAADQFIIDPKVRRADAAWARAMGQEARSVIAGYHWFTDWGRDTMISLDGLTLHTGREREAAAILRTFQHYVKDGLLPNMFPEGEREGLYHTADATLWFFHAIERYLRRTGDDELLRDLFPTLAGIVEAHVRGTHFGIRIDQDGLMAQGQDGYQLTWMDAKVEGWVVTPRRGKAVELNALWHNAVRLMEEWAPRVGADPRKYAELAERCQNSFNARFWNETTQCLYDVVDAEGGGDDPAIRPNQVFAISVTHPVLARERWETVLETVARELVTPFGLRTLSRSHSDYKRAYDGDLRARDAAYHQGTVWPWLIGHYIDAVFKLHGDKQKARELLQGLAQHFENAGIGQVSEIFDADPPHRPRGCIAQAWSVAELLRAWVATSPN